MMGTTVGVGPAVGGRADDSVKATADKMRSPEIRVAIARRMIDPVSALFE